MTIDRARLRELAENRQLNRPAHFADELSQFALGTINLLDALDAAERERDALAERLAPVDERYRQVTVDVAALKEKWRTEERERIATWHDERRAELYIATVQAPFEDRELIHGQMFAHEFSAKEIRSGRAVPASKGESK